MTGNPRYLTEKLDSSTWGSRFSVLTVASDDQKLIIIGDIMGLHIRECGHNLRLWREVGALFEFKVANSSGKRKIAIYTSKVDETASCLDALLFACENLLARSNNTRQKVCLLSF